MRFGPMGLALAIWIVPMVTVDLLAHEKNIANVKAWCQYHPKETVMSGLQNATGQR